MNYRLTIFLFLLIFAPNSKAAPNPEEITERFAMALNRFDAEAMAEEMHSDALDFFKRFSIHIASSPKNEDDRNQLLEAFRVSTITELKALDAKTATTRFYQFAFGNVRQEIKDVADQSSIRIIGSLKDGEDYCVLYRTDLTVEGVDTMVPSVIILREEDGELKVLNTTQMETVKAKAYAQGLKKEN